MAFTVRFAEYSDMAECSGVEHESMPNYPGYVADAWHYYMTNAGKMICVFDGDEMVGIGRFSVMPDGTGWLEALRVSKAHQGKGAGKLIYKKYHELAREYGCPSMAMYTGERNVVSAGLAAKNGLSLAAKYRGYHLTALSGGNAHGFHPVNPQRASELVMPKKDEYNGMMVFNRTFYHINEANVCSFAAEGKAFEDTDGSFVVCGARFQHHAALHIAMMGGDYDKCIDFAVNHARAMGVDKVSCTFALANDRLEETLKRRGFTPDPGDIITMEIRF